MSAVEKTKEFICLVQDQPCLWQKQHKQFMNRDMRQKKFEEISRKSEMTVDACKKKLKTLKDKMREITNKLPKTKSGQPAFEMGTNVVRWPFYESLLFMKDQFVGREMQGSFRSSTQDESLQEDSMLTTSGNSDNDDDDVSVESTLPPSGVPKPILTKPARMSKKARLDEQFLSLEREKLDNLKKVVAKEKSKEPADEWEAFFTSVACDLRKVKDPYLVMQVKGDINKIVNDAVLSQLQQEDPRRSSNMQI